MTQADISFAPQPDTSRAAFEAIKPHKARLMTHVYVQIQKAPASCDELEVALGMSHQGCSARVHDLMKIGLIFDSGERRPTRSGRNAIVWRAK